MTPERWRSIDQLFSELVDLPPSERARILAAQDESLREPVEHLLAADARSAQAVREAVEEARDLLVPHRLGAYCITGLAGRGGMGAVFRAVRDDGAFQKQVAIKVMHTGLDTARFRQERSILAALEHPNIARLLDGGETDTGTSYIVLEYVEGVPLLEHCDRRQLSRSARLRLFLDICSAVQYAHQNLVVHRDLKPGNILVTTNGTPKLLDFGLAKLLDSEPTRTATAFQALTPHYASPEQVRGGSISVATDVYSLGVLLYELLTGRRPYEFRSLTPVEIDKTVSEAEPAAPRLSDDLDNIILKALRKEPSRRYASVQQLADDIERSLAHLPVFARPDTFRYRAGKFLRRNRYRLAGATVTLMAILIGSSVALYQAGVAQRRFNEVRGLANRFLFDFEAQISDLPGATKAREMVVTTALDYLNRLASDAGSDSDLLDEIAQAYQKTSHVLARPGFQGLGKVKDALETLEKSRAIYQQLLRRRPADRHFQRRLATTQLQICDLLIELRRYQDAQAGARSHLEMLEPLLRERPADAELRRLQIGAWRAQGMALSLSGRSGDALDPLRRAVSALDDLSRDGDPELQWRALSVLSNLGDALERRGHLQEALSIFDRAIREGEQMWARTPNSAKVARNLFLYYQRKSGLLGNRQRPNLGLRPDALQAAERSLEIAHRLFQADQDNALAALDYATAQGKLAELLGETDPLRALELNRRAISIVLKGAAGDYRERYSRYYPMAAAEPLRVLGRTAEASAGLHQAERATIKLIAAAPEDVDLKLELASIYRGMGDIESSRRNWTAATAAWERARGVLEPMAQAKPDFIRLQYQLAEIYRKLAGAASHRDREEELRWRREVVSLWQRWLRRTPESPFGRQKLSEAAPQLESVHRRNNSAPLVLSKVIPQNGTRHIRR